MEDRKVDDQKVSMKVDKADIGKWEKKIKKPIFWTKVAATGIGALVALGYIPEPIILLVGEQVSSAIGVAIAAGFGIWLGKDDEKEKTKGED